jgi:signal transduction histidine kinase/ActR/RegA family two-component response regulator
VKWVKTGAIMKKIEKKSDASILHQKALELLKLKLSGSTSHYAEDDVQKLIHELEVHQIELELQNAELMRARSVAQHALKKYAELYDFAPSGYFTLSKSGEIIDLNLSGANLIGKERARLKHDQFGFFVSDDTKPIFNHFLNNIFSSKVKMTCEVALLTNADLPIYVYISGIITENGEQCLIAVIDINERKKVEQDLIKAKEKAEESDRLKSAFLANMSHEIRTPMNGILGFTELLKKPELTGEKQQQYISMIEKGGVRMLNIINDIISISKVESGQMEVSISETNINEQIEYIYTFFKPEVQRKGMKLLWKNSLPAKEAIIKTDREKIYAILTNLVQNAIKYSDGGTIEFGYNLKTIDESTLKSANVSAELEFYVKDTGIGIPHDKRIAIFERFVQADIGDKRAFQGAGLGLSISKAYVEMLGGRIWVESEEGKGSTFYFTIPYNQEPEEIKDVKESVYRDDESHQNKKYKILIADDDELSAMLLTEIVKKFSKEVLYAGTGVEAIETCRSNPDIDLILMDIQMPVMDGYEATSQIRHFNKEVIIIAQTAYALMGDRAKAINAGCNDYVSKPLNRNLIIDLLEKHLDNSVVSDN